MAGQRMLALALIVAGALGLAYGGFTYTKNTSTADVGPLHLSVNEQHHVNVPIWLGLGAIALGGLLLVVAKKN